MTQTPRRSGIRLPWSHEEGADEEPAEVEATATEPEAAAIQTAQTETAQTESAQPDAGQPASTESAGTGQAVGGDATPAPMSEEDNALLASLISAMREVADRQRETSVSSLKSAVDEAIDRLRSRSAEEAEQLRSKADLDITGITDWVRTETERVEAEGRARTESRREQLTQQLAAHEERSQHQIEEMQSRVADYERELAAFFSQLHDIRDPAVFGTAAKRMPRPPELGVPEPPAEAGTTDATVAAATDETSAAEEPAVEVEPAPEETVSADETVSVDESADATPPVDEWAPAPAADAVEEAEASTVNETSEAATAVADTPTTDDADEFETQTPTAFGAESSAETLRQRMDALGIPEASATEASDTEASDTEASAGAGQEEPARDGIGLAERLAQLDARIGATAPAEEPAATVASPGPGGEVATAIMVSGLGSFGAITSFKQALERVEGVHGISLSLGPTGEFVYRATHEENFDLVAAIGEIENGTAQIERQADGSLRVAVQRGR